MKFTTFLLSFIFIGCASGPQTKPVLDEHATCSLVASASGTTGNVRYTCDKMACDNENHVFRCEFDNLTNVSQPGPAINISLYSNASRYRKWQSDTIQSETLKPNGSDVKWITWHKSKTADICGRYLENCTFLTEKHEGLKLIIKD